MITIMVATVAVGPTDQSHLAAPETMTLLIA